MRFFTNATDSGLIPMVLSTVPLVDTIVSFHDAVAIFTSAAAPFPRWGGSRR